MQRAKQPTMGHLLQKQSSSKTNEEQLGSQQWKKHDFDESTGQIYTEHSVSISSAVDLQWTQRVGLDLEPNSLQAHWDILETSRERAQRQGPVAIAQNPGGSHQAGAPSLRKIALNNVCKKVSDITLETIRHLPNQLIRDIWNSLLQSDLVSFDTWKIFSKCLRQETGIRPEILKFAQTIPTPKLPLRVYTTPITSNAFDFITSLCINVPFPIPELVKISRIINLGALEIVKPKHIAGSGSEEELQFGVGDRLMRAWHHAAEYDGAFPVLRILKLRNHKDLTNWSLTYLNAFPSLAIFDVRGCSFSNDSKQQARALGWTMHYVTDVPKLLQETCFRRATSLASQPCDVNSDTKDTIEHSSGTFAVCRIPRSQMPSFFGMMLRRTPLQRLETSKSMQRRTRIPGTTGLSRTSYTEPWESANYNSFARVGELRNDSDLARAGVSIGDLAILGDSLLSSIPVASVRLGSLRSYENFSSLADVDPKALSFVSIKAPSADKARRGKQGLNAAAQTLGRMGTTGETMDSFEGDIARTPSMGGMRNKKRTLEDELWCYFD